MAANRRRDLDCSRRSGGMPPIGSFNRPDVCVSDVKRTAALEVLQDFQRILFIDCLPMRGEDTVVVFLCPADVCQLVGA